MADLRDRYQRYNPQDSGHDDVRQELDRLMGDRYDVAIFGAIAGSHVITALVLGIYSVVHQNDIFRAAADEVADAGVD